MFQLSGFCCNLQCDRLGSPGIGRAMERDRALRASDPLQMRVQDLGRRVEGSGCRSSG